MYVRRGVTMFTRVQQNIFDSRRARGVELGMKKFTHRVCLRWVIFAREAIKPLTDRLAFLQFLAFPILLYFIWNNKGFWEMLAEFQTTFSMLEALFWAVPLYLVWCAVFAIFRVQKEEKENGQWAENRFLYHFPQHIKTFQFDQKDNDKCVRINVRGDRQTLSVLSRLIIKTGWGR